MRTIKKIMAGVLALGLIWIPVAQVRATEGGNVGNAANPGTGTIAEGESIYDKVIKENQSSGGTGVTAETESIINNIVEVTPEVSPIATPGTDNSGISNGEVIPDSMINSEDLSTPVIMPEEESFSETPDKEVSEQIPDKNSIGDMQSTIYGIYLATGVEGSAVITEVEEIRQNYGLEVGEEPYVKFFNLNTEKNPVTINMLEAAAASQGAEAGPMLNIELGKMMDGKYNLLSSDGAEIAVALGIPEYFVNTEKTYAVACIRKNGKVFIMEDLDEKSETVTFNTTGGTGAYVIIRY